MKVKARSEDTFRQVLLVGALISWLVAAAVTAGVYAGFLEMVAGWGLIANMSLALAVTITVVWAQFRVRRVIIEALNVGRKIQRDLDALDREAAEAHHEEAHEHHEIAAPPHSH